jgi:hypothetical protein
MNSAPITLTVIPHVMGDDTPGAGPDIMADTETRWLGYDEIAKALGIAPASARRLVARRQWPRKPGNDGRALIAIPLDRLTPDSPPDVSPADIPDVAHDSPPRVPPDVIPDTVAILAAMGRHVEHLEQELGNVRGERDAAKAERDAAIARATALTGEAAIASALRTTLDALKTALEAEKGRLIEVRADRDRWHQEAVAPRGLFKWLRRA